MSDEQLERLIKAITALRDAVSSLGDMLIIAALIGALAVTCHGAIVSAR